MTYGYDNGRQFVIYCWNIFSTISFVQECLKRFGEPGDQFVLTYREKDEKETVVEEAEAAAQEELVQQFKGYRNPFSSMLIESKNLIFRGAPGTGKSYLAKEIAADIISNGYGHVGQPCAVCGCVFEKITVGGRSSCYCPNCQRKRA